MTELGKTAGKVRDGETRALPGSPLSQNTRRSREGNRENFLRTGADVGYNRPMLQTARPKKKKAPTEAPVHEKYLEAFRWMLLARTFEEKLASMYRGGRITGGVYVGKGQEAVSVAGGIFLQKEKGDIFAPLIRDQ